MREGKNDFGNTTVYHSLNTGFYKNLFENSLTLTSSILGE